MAKTVLIIEDDGAVAQLLRDVLESEGFDVLVEPDGEWGLRTFETKTVDLVVADLLLPKLKGFELVERLRKLPHGREVPIIIVSGVYRSLAVREDLIQRHQIAELLDKPIDVDRFIDVLHDIFSSAYPEPHSTPTGEHRLLPELRKSLERSAKPSLLDVPDKGDLETIPFANVLGKLYRTRATGALMLRKASVKKIVYLREGIPVFVKSNLLAECLGRIMVQERLISQDECDDSLRRKKKEKKRQGEILVQTGSISQHNLDFALELQMQIKLFDMFSWLEGRYQFNDRGDYSATQIALPMGPTALIYEGASRAMSNDRIARELARVAEAKIAPSPDPSFRYQTLHLDPRADRLVDKIDGTRTMGGLLDSAEFDRADAAPLLYALCCAGLLEPAGDARPVSDLIPLDEADVEILSTGEINAIAELASVGEAPDDADANWENLEALIDASAEEALDPATEPPAPAPLPEPPPQPSAPSLFDDDDDQLEDPLEGATEEAFSIDDASDTFQSDPALPDRAAPRSWTLPREPRRTPKLGEPPPPPPADSSEDTPLSDEIRRQVRERLEAQVARLAESRVSERPKAGPPLTKKFPTRPTPTSTHRRAQPRDLEKEKRLEAELTERLELMEELTYYELLEVADDARIEIIRTAYHALARKHDPERVAGQSTSRIVHKTAEQIYLLLTRALSTLTNEAARSEYDRKIGIHQTKQADVIAADAAFEMGNGAASRGDWRAARELYERAVRLNRDEGVYLAHLAWSHYQGEGNEDRALELLDRAAERSPRSEEIHLFSGQIHEKAGRRAEAVRAYQQALVCNADCVRALEALKVLDPPSNKRSGLLSRLNLS